MTVSELTFKTKDISRAALKRYATFSPNEVPLAYKFIKAELLEKLMELLDEAGTSNMEFSTRMEFRRFRKHLDKVIMEIEDQKKGGDPHSAVNHSCLLPSIGWMAEDTMGQLETLLSKAMKGELREGESEDWGLHQWDDFSVPGAFKEEEDDK